MYSRAQPIHTYSPSASQTRNMPWTYTYDKDRYVIYPGSTGVVTNEELLIAGPEVWPAPHFRRGIRVLVDRAGVTRLARMAAVLEDWVKASAFSAEFRYAFVALTGLIQGGPCGNSVVCRVASP